MLLTFLGRTHVGDYGWPAGGSIALARALGRRFLKLGGEIRYEARVQSIIVENERAVGVRLSDGTEQRADIVAGFDFPALVPLAKNAGSALRLSHEGMRVLRTSRTITATPVCATSA